MTKQTTELTFTEKQLDLLAAILTVDLHVQVHLQVTAAGDAKIRTNGIMQNVNNYVMSVDTVSRRPTDTELNAPRMVAQAQAQMYLEIMDDVSSLVEEESLIGRADHELWKNNHVALRENLLKAAGSGIEATDYTAIFGKVGIA